MASDKPGREVVFIGNIPYGLTEEQIVHILSSVGQVLNFRLVYDNDTGRPKGFGFAEFNDTDAAASAVRNLNNYEVMGRQLRVDFSHVGGKDNKDDQSQQQQAPPAENGLQGGQDSVHVNGLPPLPPGVDLAPNLTCPDAISKTLSTLPTAQLLDILSQMKGLVMGDPAKATELLRQAPQLSYAIFQALLLMGLVDSSALTSVISENTQPQQPPPQQHQIPPPPQQRPTPLGYQQPPPQQPQQQQQQQYGQYAPPPHMQQGPPMGHVPTPPVPGGMYQPPPQQQAPPPMPQMDPALIQQVLSMPQQQIDSLGPSERAQLMNLRQQLIAAGARY